MARGVFSELARHLEQAVDQHVRAGAHAERPVAVQPARASSIRVTDTAPNLLAGPRERSPRPIDVLINSRHHPDHTGGNGVLRPPATQIVAHTRLAENQQAGPSQTRGVIGRRGFLHYPRDHFTPVVKMARRARCEGRAKERLAKVKVLPTFEHPGGITARLGIALTLAYDELATRG